MRALVLSGGAAWGAYQAGVLAEFAEAGIEFDVAIGASAGAFNAGAYAQGIGARLPGIWRAYAPPYIQPRRLLEGASPFRFTEASRAIARDLFDARCVRRAPCELVIAVTDYATGEPVAFSSRSAGFSDEELRLQFETAAWIPGLSKEPILIRGRQYCDGGFSSLVPIREAIVRGAHEVWLVDCVARAAPLARLATLLLRPLGLLPMRMARLLSRYLHDVSAKAPDFPGRLVRVVPSEPLGFLPFDFRLAALESAIEVGRRDGRRVVAEQASMAGLAAAGRCPSAARGAA